MGLDYGDSVNQIRTKIQAIQTVSQSLNDYNTIQAQVRNNLEQPNSATATAVNNLQQDVNRFQRQALSQLQNLLNISQINGTTLSGGTISYITKTFIQVLNRIGPTLQTILQETAIGCIGCSLEQQFTPTEPIYIKVSAIDINNILKNITPGLGVGRYIYEPRPPINRTVPFSMNDALWQLIQQPNLPFSTIFGGPMMGTSGQPLFDILYTQVDNFGQTGDFFQVILLERNINNISNFLLDYYSTINIIDFNNIYVQILETLTNFVSISANIGYGDLVVNNQVATIIERILGLCFDANANANNVNEIDVSGTAQISELDGAFDDSFFEFTDIDLRNINDTVNNIYQGVIELQDCNNVQLPVDTATLSTAMDNILHVILSGTTADLDALGQNLPTVISQSPQWQQMFPNGIDLNLHINLSMLLNMPQAIVFSLLTPKVLLPLFILLKSISSPVVDAINDFKDFFAVFRKCMVTMITRIGAIFIKEIFTIIKKDIIGMIKSVIGEIHREKVLKKYTIIQKLISILSIIGELISDFRHCKSVLDEILALLNLATNGTGGLGGDIPLPLLAASFLLDGFSTTRAYTNVIEEYQKLGFPTGPMPDGSPNLFVLSEYAKLKGFQQEDNENGKIQIFAPPLVVTPAFLTLPSSNLYGKRI